MNLSKIFKIIYLIIAALTIIEYLCLAGLFTGPVMMILVWIAFFCNFIFSIKEKNWNETLLYVVCTLALNMGYWKLMF